MPQIDDSALNIFTGTKRGLVILTEFQDTKFKRGHDREKYDCIMNEPGYTTNEGFRGSVADYFRDQSGGLFDLQFDVVGPYTAANKYSYYGKNDDDGNDYLLVCHSVIHFRHIYCPLSRFRERAHPPQYHPAL